ncbi:MAG: hypothetical protein NTZ59_14830, partial [Bacteroidetes bacterium]|nr:hypothetical protein [Bacteroidota bacterium]
MPFFTDEEKKLFKTRTTIGKLKFILGNIKRKCYLFLFKNISFFKPAYDTQHHENPITIKHLFYRNVLRRNRSIYWPIHPSTVINGVQNIYAGIDTSPGLSNGCYIQAVGKVYIGDYTLIS